MRTTQCTRNPLPAPGWSGWLLLALLGWSLGARAQAPTADDKLDTLLVKQQELLDRQVQETRGQLDSLLAKQQRLLEGQARIEREVVPQDPFPDGALGFAFNLPLAIAATVDETRMISASLFWFPPHSQLELVVPIWIRTVNEDSEFRGTLVDLQGRYYFSPKRAGFYWLGGLRQAWLSGRAEDRYLEDFTLVEGRHTSFSKSGVYGGVGFRAHSKRFYWNCNVAFGRYFGGSSTEIRDQRLMGEDYLLDAEFFKFGLIF
ncbi:MAG: hypothetical protein WC326_09380 [Candidatus Delongbacteria bacterium]